MFAAAMALLDHCSNLLGWHAAVLVDVAAGEAGAVEALQ
jgi:hypothetical protein